MILYHGSKTLLKYPKPKGSNHTNDYGPSFYLTKDLESAKSWACRNDTVGIVNKYSIENKSYKKLKILDLTDKTKYSVLNWIAILMHFRKLDEAFKKTNQIVLDWLQQYYIDVEQYDVVVGFRADDSYFRFPTRFVTNDLAFEDLDNIYLLGSLGIQYAFMSKRAIGLLKFESEIPCEKAFVGHYYHVVCNATKAFDEILDYPRDPAKTYVLDLMRKQHE